jgi:UrcA family protein
MHPLFNWPRPNALVIALAMAGATLGAAPLALAQPGAGPSTAQEVTVVAPEVTRHLTTAATPFLGAPIEVVSLQRAVSYADLDLTKQADAATFATRVQSAAQGACADLEAKYPSNLYVPTPADQNCVATATDRARVTAKEVIAAANTR